MSSAEIRRRLGTIRRSITNVGKRLTEVKDLSDLHEAHSHAQRLMTRLTTLDSEFKSVQYELMATIDENDEESIEAEQTALDKHDGEIDILTIGIQQLLATTSHKAHSFSDTNKSKLLSRNLALLEESLKSVDTAVSSLPLSETDVALVQQYQEELSDLKGEITTCRDYISQLYLPEEDESLVKYNQLKTLYFKCCHRIKVIIHSQSSSSSLSNNTDAKGLKNPKLEAPTFDGDILNWTQFWEQFSISIHERTNLSKSEKFVYLQHSIKGGSGKNVIEGLSGSGEHYDKAIECLKSRYDRPRLIHQSHVKTILDIPPIKEGNGKELRRLHDTLQQHLRAIDAADCEPLSQFMTSAIQLKLDLNTLFEWQKHTQDLTSVPPFTDILEFVDLRASASESTANCHSTKRNLRSENSQRKIVTTFVANSDHSGSRCLLCKSEKHPLYYCPKFKGMSHDHKLSVIKGNALCMNCLRPGHFLKECKSSHHCRVCQKPHHTLLHIDVKEPNPPSVVTSHASTGVLPDTLLMTCQVHVTAPDGSKVTVRALLDSASSSSFVSERLVQNLCIPRSRHKIFISGVAGLTTNSPLKSLAMVEISPTQSNDKRFTLNAVVVPRVTCNLPLNPVNFKANWTHLDDITLADPDFGLPGRVDLLLGVDVYVEALLSGRRSGPSGAPIAFETIFGWVLAGRTQADVSSHIATHHVTSTISDDDILRQFWEIEEIMPNDKLLSIEEQGVLNHFKENHRRSSEGRFIVSLPRHPDVKPLGESRSQALRRFISLERSLLKKDQHEPFITVMKEYLDLKHAEPIPIEDYKKPENEVFYLPMHAVYKISSTTTKVRAVFDASAKSTTGISLNDTLLVGPTVHSPLVDVLLRFRLNRIAVTTDVSKMYRAIELVESDRDLHRFVWRSSPSETIRDYRMTRVTFGVSASSFIANMCVKKNSLDLASEFPLAAEAVERSFYVDDGLTGASDVQTAIKLQMELQEMFIRGGFQLHKWNSNSLDVLQHINPDFRATQNIHPISISKSLRRPLD